MTPEVVLYIILNVILIAAVNPITGNSTTIEPCGICQNGGTCDQTVPQCICPAGFAGPNCEESTFNCNIKNCMNGGYCKTQTGECVCVQPYYGLRCEYSNDPWNSPTEDEKNRRSMIVSIIFSLVVMLAVCFVVIYINIKRLRDRREDEEADEEVRNAVQVDGPPRLRLPEGLRIKQGGYDIQREDSGCFGNQPGSWKLAFPSLQKRKRASKGGLRGISTSPAALQNSSKHTRDIGDSMGSASGVTLQECSLVSLPPPYDEATGSDDKDTSIHTNGSGLFMRCPSTLSSEDQNGSEIQSSTNGNSSERELVLRNINEINIDVEHRDSSNSSCNESAELSRKISNEGINIVCSHSQHDSTGSGGSVLTRF